MPGITHTQIDAVHSGRLRTAAVVAAVIAAFALAGVLALALGDDGTPAAQTARPAYGETSAIKQTGIRYDGGPQEGSWLIGAPNPGRPDGGPEEGTRGPGH